MKRPLLRRLIELALIAALGIGAFAHFEQKSRTVRFQGDESNYMARGRFFYYLFVKRDVKSPWWRDSYHAHTQPMLANYIVGATLWLNGRDLEQFPGYRWGQTYEENVQDGRVPDADTLWLIRQPMVFLAAGVIVLLYLLGRVLSGPLAGLLAAVVGLMSPLTQSALPRARNDCPLAFFLLLALLVAVLGARRGRRGSLPLGWALLLGVTLGFAFEAKLTAAIGILAVAAWSAVVAAAALTRPVGGGRLSGAWRSARGWLLAAVVGYVVFVAGNPHLWRGPLQHTLHLFEHRQQQMRALQNAGSGASAVYDFTQRPVRVLRGSLVQETWGGSRGVPVEAVGAAIGAALLLIRTWRRWLADHSLAPEGFTLFYIAAYFAGVSAGLWVAFSLYMLPTFLLAALLAGIGIAALACWSLASLRDAINRRLGRRALEASS